jgi:hypothetical protein
MIIFPEPKYGVFGVAAPEIRPFGQQFKVWKKNRSINSLIPSSIVISQITKLSNSDIPTVQF